MGDKFGLNVNLAEVNHNNISNKIDLKEVIPQAKEKLEHYYDKHVIVITNNFDENKWIFKYKLTNSVRTFDFEFARDTIKFKRVKNTNEFINVLKCWIAFILNERSIDAVLTSFYNVLSACFGSNCFSVEKKDIFFSKLEENLIYRLSRKEKKFTEVNVRDISIEIYCRNLIDFLNFYDSDEHNYYIQKLSVVKSKTKSEYNNRSIPSYVDILKFKKYIDFWAENMYEIDRKEYLRFFPVYLWWEITTIIPMRPSEFCFIPRNCLSTDGKYYYLTFPRLKKHRKGDNRLEDTYDILPVPQLIYERIESYIKETTNNNKESEYLIDFSTFVESTREYDINYEDDEVFTIIYLLELIGKFYKQVIYQKYKVSIKNVTGQYKYIFFYNSKREYESFICSGSDSIEKMIRPGDLRHVAILNMFLQGYDPVEIERLAGHISDETQLGYQRHMQFWVDSQTQQLAIEFSNITDSYIHTDYRVTIHPKAVEKFNKLYKRKIFIDKDLKNILDEQKLEIGYCSDETMPCSTFNWRHNGCYFCDHWGISEVELQEKREVILHDMSLIYDQLRDKVNFLKSLLLIQKDNLGNFDKETKKTLSVTSKEVQEGITNIARIMSMLGVK